MDESTAVFAERVEIARDEIERAATFLEYLVASAFDVGQAALLDVSRGPDRVAAARQVGMYLAHTRLHLSYTVAGALFGRERTTAAHACRRIEDRREDARFDAILGCLERTIDVWPGLAQNAGSPR